MITEKSVVSTEKRDIRKKSGRKVEDKPKTSRRQAVDHWEDHHRERARPIAIADATMSKHWGLRINLLLIATTILLYCIAPWIESKLVVA